MNLEKTINPFACERKAYHFKVVIQMTRVTNSWHDCTDFFKQCCTLKGINKNLYGSWHQTSAFLTGRENPGEIIHDGRAWVQWNVCYGMQLLLPHTVSFLVFLNLTSSCWFFRFKTRLFFVFFMFLVLVEIEGRCSSLSRWTNSSIQHLSLENLHSLELTMIPMKVWNS